MFNSVCHEMKDYLADDRFRTFLDFMEGSMTKHLANVSESAWNVSTKSVSPGRRAEIIDSAKKRLSEGFQYVGITNRYAESICLFFIKFAKPGNRSSSTEPLCKPAVLKSLNTATEHKQSSFNFTEEDLIYFETYDDTADREVYNHAFEDIRSRPPPLRCHNRGMCCKRLLVRQNLIGSSRSLSADRIFNNTGPVFQDILTFNFGWIIHFGVDCRAPVRTTHDQRLLTRRQLRYYCTSWSSYCSFCLPPLIPPRQPHRSQQ